MSGWLAAAKADAPVAPAPRVPEAKAGTTKVVVDANAIVKGIRLERLAEEAVTIPRGAPRDQGQASEAHARDVAFRAESAGPGRGVYQGCAAVRAAHRRPRGAVGPRRAVHRAAPHAGE